MKTKLAVVLAGLGLLWLAVPVVAHHAVGAEFDENKPVTLTGVVTKVEWTNPHARIYFDVQQPDGTAVNWNVELAARSALVRQGWTGSSLKVGETVTIQGSQARSGLSSVHARSVTRADGSSVFSNNAGQ
jgi:hypothetical protein